MRFSIKCHSPDLGFLQQGGHPQKPKGPLEALRPKLQVLKFVAFLECTYIVGLILSYVGVKSNWMIRISGKST